MPIIEVQVGKQTYANITTAFDQLGYELDRGFDEGMKHSKLLLVKSLNTVAAKMAEKHSSRWNGQVVNPTDRLQSRTGGGLRAIRDSIKVAAENNDIIAGQISAASLSFHEEGGTIRAKSAQYLTIPLPAAMDPRGVPLRTRARMWDHTFVRRSKKGNLLIFRRIPGARDLTPLYILKPEVYIRPRLGMTDAFNTEFGYFDQKVFDEISDTVDQSLGR